MAPHDTLQRGYANMPNNSGGTVAHLGPLISCCHMYLKYYTTGITLAFQKKKRNVCLMMNGKSYEAAIV